LFCTETEFDDNFECDEDETLEAYNGSYHENIACIINQATMLHTDEAFMNCFVEKNSAGKTIPVVTRITDSIKRVYFNKKDSFNRMSFLLFDGILHSLGELTNPDGSPNEQEAYASRSTFMNLFDINNDLFLLSTECLDSEKIKNYETLDLQIDSSYGDGADTSIENSISKIDEIRIELIKMITDMRRGRLHLDPNVS
jgi:hypothetical protein